MLNQLPSWVSLQSVAGSCIVVLLTVFLIKWRRNKEIRAQLRAAAAELRAKRERSIRLLKEKLGEGLTEERKAIVELSACSLAEAIKGGKYTALEVLYAFWAKALEVHEDVNCITDFILEAEDWAKELDARGPRENELLYGVPISIKDNISVKGYASTLGQAKNAKAKDEDAVLVEVIKAKGGVPFCKTNVPQTLLSYGCSNPIFGTTENPVQKGRVPGGSSGGETCLLKRKGSPLGVGGDVAGSIRLPSHMSGVCGLKCSAARFSRQGCMNSVPGVQLVKVAYGYMARSVDDIALGMKASCSDETFTRDANVAPIEFKFDVYNSKEKLTIGYYDYNDLITVTPGLKRAVHLTKEALEKQGHRLVPFTVPRGYRAFFLAVYCLAFDGARALYDGWLNEEVDQTLKVLHRLVSLPVPVKIAMSRLVGLKWPRVGELLAGFRGPKDSYHLRLIYSECEEYKTEFIKAWKAANLDAVICPPCVFPAPPPEYPQHLSAAAAYTILYNMLDFPAGVVPVTVETAEDQENLKTYPQKDAIDWKVKMATEGAEGLPIGVQCVTLPWKEEVCLRVMKEVEQAVAV